MRPLLALILAGCEPEPVDTEPEPVAPEFAFAFAVLADPHVSANNEHDERLRAAVGWIAERVEERDIELVLVAGDVAWHGGHGDALDALHEAPIPVVPIIGDNEIQFGEEQVWDEAFSEHFAALEEQLDGFRRPPRPTWNPEREQESWFQSFVFEHRGVRFVGCDLSPRVVDPIWGEMAEAHDFEGGTLPWLRDALADAASRADESIVLVSHQPMMMVPGGFVVDDWEKVVALLGPVADKVAMNLAGHLHVNGETSLEDAGIDVYLTDATWDDEVTVRVVDVWTTGDAFTFEHELVEVPWPPPSR
jgi:3',5'-cyclic AMP phosphodiesterase CpdA